jgi:hypothetical protein
MTGLKCGGRFRHYSRDLPSYCIVHLEYPLISLGPLSLPQGRGYTKGIGSWVRYGRGIRLSAIYIQNERRGVMITRQQTDVRFISGIKNYHKVGINGYIIRNRINEREGMIRVVHNTGDGLISMIGPNGDFMFAPHNHRQDITLYGLTGNAVNITFRFDKRVSGHGGFQYIFGSEIIDGKMETRFRDCGDLDVLDVQPITEFGIVMKSQEIHTLVTEPGAAWLIVEGELATVRYPRHINYCYSTSSLFQLTSTPDLYQPINIDYLKAQEDRFGDRIRGILGQ